MRIKRRSLKLDKVKNFAVKNIIFNELIENFEQMKLRNQNQNDIRSFFRS